MEENDKELEEFVSKTISKNKVVYERLAEI